MDTVRIPYKGKLVQGDSILDHTGIGLIAAVVGVLAFVAGMAYRWEAVLVFGIVVLGLTIYFFNLVLWSRLLKDVKPDQLDKWRWYV